MGNFRPLVSTVALTHPTSLPLQRLPCRPTPPCHAGISPSEQGPLPNLCTQGQSQGSTGDRTQKVMGPK